MPAAHARDDAIRHARRIGDPAAVCAALAVLGAWETDEERGRGLAERFVEEGLLDPVQIRRLVGIEVSAPVATWVAQRAEAASPVALMEATEASAPPPCVEDAVVGPLAPPTEPQSAEVAAAEAPSSAEPASIAERPSRWPLLAAAALGIAVALTFWAFAGKSRPRAEAPPSPHTRLAVFHAVPVPPPPRPPGWAPGLRQVRDGDSPAVHDHLHRMAKQMAAWAEATRVSFEARDVLVPPPRKDRVLRWVELELGRFHAVRELRGDGVDVAWARE